jgi:hypothetical protein
MGMEDLAKAVEEALLLPQQLRQLGDVCRNPPRLVFRELLRRRSRLRAAGSRLPRAVANLELDCRCPNIEELVE